MTTCGVHTFEVWDRAIPAARAWGFFDEVPEQPERWVYRSIATSGEMWGLRLRFAAPPSAVVRFERAGAMLTAAGSGDVVITVPFHRPLPAACLRSP